MLFLFRERMPAAGSHGCLRLVVTHILAPEVGVIDEGFEDSRVAAACPSDHNPVNWISMARDNNVVGVFRSCVAAIRAARLIHRESRQDKEFHFQNWFRDRLVETNCSSTSAAETRTPTFD